MRDDKADREKRPNISTENQPPGSARQPRDTLDRPPGKGPGSSSARGRPDGK